MILNFLLIALIVGFVTAGLKIRFDRFFTILLLLFISGRSIPDAVNIFLWVIMLGALMVILDNRSKIVQIPKPMKTKLFVMVPIFTFMASLIGSWVFTRASAQTLLITLGVLAILYGFRLIFIHFKKHELEYKEGDPVITKLCGLVGPWLSGFFIGFIGTSLKPLKISFAIKVGKMNIQKVYLGNVITTFFASLFSIMWHFVLSKEAKPATFYEQMILGMAIWTGVHYIYEISSLFFHDKWRKAFQIVIGVLLVLVSVKVFALA